MTLPKGVLRSFLRKIATAGLYNQPLHTFDIRVHVYGAVTTLAGWFGRVIANRVLTSDVGRYFLRDFIYLRKLLWKVGSSACLI